MKHIVFFIFLFSVNINCIPDEPSQHGDSRIVWKTKYANEEYALPSLFDPIIDKDKIYISRWDGEKNDALISINKMNGELDWAWATTRISSIGKEILYSFYSMIQYKNILVGRDDKYLVGISSDEGKTVWNKEFPSELKPGETLYNGIIYYRSIDFDESELNLYEIDPLTGEEKNKYVFKSPFEEYEIYNYGSNVYQNSNSETCILLGMLYVKDYYKPTEVKRYGLINYNLDKQEYIFNKTYDIPVGIYTFYLHDDKIFADGSYFSTFDYKTGELINQFKEGDLTYSPYTSLFDYPHAYLMYNNIVNKLVKVNMETGKELWRTSLDGHQSYRINKYREKLYLTARDGRIYIVDSSIGTVDEKITASPYFEGDSRGYFDDEFSYDKETGYFYFTDFIHIICYDFSK